MTAGESEEINENGMASEKEKKSVHRDIQLGIINYVFLLLI